MLEGRCRERDESRTACSGAAAFAGLIREGEFVGNRGEFFRLVRNGAALELVTFGFYRFWLATDIRRPFVVAYVGRRRRAEYTGRGRELLIGFLFALAILVPIYLAYFVISIEAEQFEAFGSVPLFLFFYLFGQFAIYRRGVTG